MLATPEIVTRDDALDFLTSRINYERTTAPPVGSRELKLDRMHDLLSRLDQPHVGVPVIHVAGTKGKGSVSAMLASILTCAGYRTGLYTSPHLTCMEERWKVDGEDCSAEEFAAHVRRLAPAVLACDAVAPPGEAGPTYFDLATAVAWLHFRQRRVDIAVLEVGLGGRLDSTNVCEPLVTAITSISRDHQNQLGNTLAAIAREKAGIFKPGIPAISGALDPEPADVIAQRAKECGCPLAQLGRDFGATYIPPRQADRMGVLAHCDYWSRYAGGESRINNITLNLLGAHQAENAAIALAVLEALARQGWNIPEAAIRRGLENVRWPARVEIIHRQPTVVLDSAHNVASVEALVRTLQESFSPRRRTLVFATTQDKEIEPMLRVLLPRFERVILTRYQSNPRGLPLESLRSIAHSIAPHKCEWAANPSAAWEAASRALAADDLACITGSVFIAGEMRALLET